MVSSDLWFPLTQFSRQSVRLQKYLVGTGAFVSIPAQTKCTHLLQRPSQRIQLSDELAGSPLLFIVQVGKSHVWARGKLEVKTPQIGSVPQLIKTSLPTLIALPAANGLNLVAFPSNETFSI